MEEISFRYATAKDAEMLSSLASETFWDTYRNDARLKHKHIKNYIKRAFNLKKIKSEITEQNTIFIIGKNKERQIGYSKLLLKSSENSITGNNPMEISRIYLRKDFWGKKLGATLLQKCFEEAKNNNCDVIWLSVWEHNQRAIKFYEKHGFEKSGTHTFDLASSMQTDYLMQKRICQIYR